MRIFTSGKTTLELPHDPSVYLVTRSGEPVGKVGLFGELFRYCPDDLSQESVPLSTRRSTPEVQGQALADEVDELLTRLEAENEENE